MIFKFLCLAIFQINLVCSIGLPPEKPDYNNNLNQNIPRQSRRFVNPLTSFLPEVNAENKPFINFNYNQNQNQNQNQYGSFMPKLQYNQNRKQYGSFKPDLRYNQNHNKYGSFMPELFNQMKNKNYIHKPATQIQKTVVENVENPFIMTPNYLKTVNGHFIKVTAQDLKKIFPNWKIPNIKCSCSTDKNGKIRQGDQAILIPVLWDNISGNFIQSCDHTILKGTDIEETKNTEDDIDLSKLSLETLGKELENCDDESIETQTSNDNSVDEVEELDEYLQKDNELQYKPIHINVKEFKTESPRKIMETNFEITSTETPEESGELFTTEISQEIVEIKSDKMPGSESSEIPNENFEQPRKPFEYILENTEESTEYVQTDRPQEISDFESPEIIQSTESTEVFQTKKPDVYFDKYGTSIKKPGVVFDQSIYSTETEETTINPVYHHISGVAFLKTKNNTIDELELVSYLLKKNPNDLTTEENELLHSIVLPMTKLSVKAKMYLEKRKKNVLSVVVIPENHLQEVDQVLNDLKSEHKTLEHYVQIVEEDIYILTKLQKNIIIHAANRLLMKLNKINVNFKDIYQLFELIPNHYLEYDDKLFHMNPYKSETSFISDYDSLKDLRKKIHELKTHRINNQVIESIRKVLNIVLLRIKNAPTSTKLAQKLA